MAEGPCIRCGAEKFRSARGKVYCKPCANRRDRDWRIANNADVTARQRQRHSRNREADNARASAYYQAHRDEFNAAVKEWQRANRPRVLEYKRKWSSTHPEKGREYAGKRRALKLAAVCSHGFDCVTAGLLASIIEQPCVYCGSAATDGDHVVPLTRGGLHCVDNLVPACGPCNKSKGNRLLGEWNNARETA